MAIKVGLRYIEQGKESMEDEVLAYEAEPQEKGQIVFYGPSYFTRWGTRFGMKPMRDVLLGYADDNFTRQLKPLVNTI